MKYLIIPIILIAAIFRFYGLDWDSGFHLHPDERMITMVAGKISFLDLNPHFFAYGSLPLYLLKTTGTFLGIFNPEFAYYAKINLAGRALSTLFDIGTLIVLYFLAKKVFDQKVALLSAFFYGVAVLPIQLSHFYAVDTSLTFFIMLTLFLLVRHLENPKSQNILFVSVSFGLALATKTSAILLAVPIGMTILLKFSPRRIPLILLIPPITLIVFFIFEPFAFLDFKNFWLQTMQQQQMTRDAFTFPYTLQYVDIIPYLYELKNIFLWGLGPALAVLSFAGVILVTFQALAKIKLASQDSTLQGYNIILLSFFWIYLGVTGSFAVGWMRYMLPLYPLLCLFAAFFFNSLITKIKKYLNFNTFLNYTLYAILYTLLLIWPLAFVQIYSEPNTRVQATTWINQNILPGQTLAIEHWDDGLPLLNMQNYRILTLPLYDFDTVQKWSNINQILSQTDYIIIASNRLYTPLQKLTDCENLPAGRCYRETTQYYQKLFDGSLGFSKVAEFSVFPGLGIKNWKLEIDDSSSDESFTVYDHPKVMIFKKNL
ncbi:hypothetical protein A2617_01160 [Candidatus Daviesbacteria bacterium RIFOXYD1_FULL_41_10]|uniref:Glycosyltransferase RgtA/B/C/D-like domain-containing protein n=1 Tax=Candidatus Daviesbacteria bacterium RIFOXYD1_FULL_41_10 TaxID=1797801 RepID=A0A1F5N038_9BACT|nr:MAG: hypothetical protein A2617_01160 [Candidatus Daviesbacteria bacterium RIFOXYD1_FULL_41_10]